MTERNDHCPCGSGKKYKKCCWPKDRAARAQALEEVKQLPTLPEIDHILDYDEPESILTPSAAEDSLPTPEDDPLMERINAFWDQFMEASYEKQWSLVTEMLVEEPELCDDEMVFEITNTLFEKAVDAGETHRYKQLLQQLAEAVPEAYAQELHYILEQHIQIALMEEDDATLAHYFYQFSPLAGDHLDNYYRVIPALAYHGKLEILYQGMRQARPYVAEGAGLVEWAYSEFTSKVADLEIVYRLAQNPHLTPDDSTLQQHFEEYEITIMPEGMTTLLDYYIGRKTPTWTAADFVMTKGKEKDLARESFTYLMAAFTYYAHREEGTALTKAEMVSEQLSRYFGLRHEGELDETGGDYGRRPKRSRKRKTKQVSPHPLCPDAQTLDRFMAQLMGFMSFRYYETCALFELIPTWLRFLTRYNLLEEEVQQQTVKALSYLKDSFVQIADKQLTDPAIKENLMDWPY